MVGTEWYGYVGNAMSAPVSDGDRVYVVYGQVQVAAYDLDCLLVWAKRFAEANGLQACNLSPVLCDNMLILKFPDGRTWRALDARIGALLWERKDAPRFQTKFPSARVVRLRTAPGEPVNAAVYPDALQIRRAEDDRVLGEFPDSPRPEHGYHFLVHRDLVLIAGRVQAKTPATVYRLRTTAADRVDLENVYNMSDAYMQLKWVRYPPQATAYSSDPPPTCAASATRRPSTIGIRKVGPPTSPRR